MVKNPAIRFVSPGSPEKGFLSPVQKTVKTVVILGERLDTQLKLGVNERV